MPSTLFNYENIILPSHYTTNSFPARFQFQFAAIQSDNTPNDNLITNEGATLGRVLFYDKKLSANATISCSSCHKQEHGFSDPEVLSKGFEGGHTGRHSMGLTNARFYGTGKFFWDERAATLEDQVLMPFQDPIEMGLTLPQLEQLVRSQPYYSSLFTAAFGNDSISSDRISKALAQFIRSIVSINSKYDIGRAMTSSPLTSFPNFTLSENNGKSLFNAQNLVAPSCNSCHLSEAFVAPLLVGGATTIGTNNGLDIASTTDQGIYESTGINGHRGKFKVPSLKNIAVRPPYMHDGRFASLAEVIDHYSTGIKNHPTLQPFLKDSTGNAIKYNFTTQEKADLVAFLNTLTDNQMLTDENTVTLFNKIYSLKHLSFFILIIVLFNCKKEVEIECTGTSTVTTRPNVLLIIADDMGLDATPGYNVGTIKPTVPNIQNMINTGVRYNNFWSYPTCTPTRASILTGKYGFRTNVVKVDDPLAITEISLQKHIDNNTGNRYAHAVIGKWHLSRTASHPTDMGVGYYAGLLSGAANSYTDWNFTENGTTSNSTDYITEKITDLAIDWVDAQTKPWFLWLAYTAPHTPFHLPPANMHSQGALPSDAASIDANPLPYYMAMIEAMDYQIGRLLDSMNQEERDNTIIIFIGDNGSPGQVVQKYASRRAKGSVYKGGINVPMIVSGKGVSRANETDDAFAGTVDIFATIADITGTGTTQINDSWSFRETFSKQNKGIRDYIYSEVGNTSNTNTDYTLRNATHKYIMFNDGSEALYNLSLNEFENPNLMSVNQLPLSTSDSIIKAELEAEIARIKM